MTLSDFLADLNGRQVRLQREGERLRCTAPAGVLTPELTRRIEQRRDEILGYLRARDDIAVGRRPELVPLSFAQEGLWLLSHLEPADSAYHIPLALRLSGPLNLTALAQALTELARRHEVLRTVYPARRGRPFQHVGPPVRLPLAVIDLAALADQERAARVLREAAALRPFDLAVGPVMRAALLRLDRHDHLLLITRHHIASDGWSFSVLAHDVETLYAGFTAGIPARLPELAVQYADFACWQRQAALTAEFKARAERRRFTLDGAGPAVSLIPASSADEPPRPARTLRQPLAPDLSDRLRQLARASGTTTFAVMLTGFGLALASGVGQREVVVGTPASGRVRPELDPLIGSFATMLPLRLAYAADGQFAQAIRQSHEVVARALDDQDIPLEAVIEAARPQRSLDPRWPLFSVAFVMQNTPPARLRLPGVRVEAEEPVAVGPKYPLTVTVLDQDGELALVAEFDSAVHPAAAADILDRFVDILSLGSMEPRLSCGKLARAAAGSPPGPAAETDPVPQTTLTALLESMARHRPDAIAVSYGDDQITYAELLRRARRLAVALQSDAGVAPEAMVGVCADPSADLVIAVVGIALAGGAYVPLDPDDPALRHESVMANSGMVALVTSARYADAFAWFDGPVLPAVEARSRSAAPPQPGPSRTAVPGNLAYVIYTSGSTGTPKGVMVSHANVTAMFAAADSVLPFSAADVWTMAHSSAFDFSVWEMWGALVHGARLVVLPRDVIRDPAALWQMLADERVTVLSSTPAAFQALVPVAIPPERTTRSGLRIVVLGGDRCEPSRLRAWLDAFGDDSPWLVNMYGITETTVHVTHHRLTRSDLDGTSPASPIGRPLSCARTHVGGPDGVPAAVGGRGELAIGGFGVTRGYLGQPGLTAARFLPDAMGGPPGSRAYASGDLVRPLPGGQLEYLGRADDQIQLRGYRIEPAEIVAALEEHAGVAAAAVTARQDGTRSFLAAYVVSRDTDLRPHQGPAPVGTGNSAMNGQPSAGELRRHLTERLPGHMIPATFTFLERLPLTRNGKLDRAALPHPDSAGGSAGPPIDPPRTATEEALVALWCELLGTGLVGIHDNFFELGGDSLLVTRLHARLPEIFGVDLPMQRIYRALDIAALAEVIDLQPASAGSCPDSESSSDEPESTRRSDG